MAKCVLFFLFVILPRFTWAAEGVKVQASLDRNQVGIGDVINLTVSISAQDSVQVTQPTLPDLKGFELINTSSGSETRSTFQNGRFLTQQTRNFNFMLAITDKGTLTIPQIAVTVDGQPYLTQAIKVSATGTRSTPPPTQQAQRQKQRANDPFQDMDDMEEIFNQMLQRRMAPNLHGQGGNQGQFTPPSNPDEAFQIIAEADKTKAYVGEQITVNYYLYTRGNIRDIDTLKYPDLRGFWKEEIEMATRLNMEQVTMNGIVYQRALLVSYALFPIKPGKATIDPYKAKCTVVTMTNMGFGRPYQFTKASRAIDVEVLDVPVDGRPPNYTGAVGNFRVSAQFEPPTSAVNSPVTMRVRFEGKGNAKLIELPKLDLPPSFEIYDQKNQAKFARDGSSFKEFEVMIIPREPGVFQVAPVLTATFDPQSHKFTTLSSQPLVLTVTGTATTPALPGTVTKPNEPSAPVASAQSELPALSNSMDSGDGSRALLNILAVLALVAAAAVIGWSAWSTLRRRPKRASLSAILKRRLKTVREYVDKGEWRKVGVELTNTLYFMMGQISEQGGANVDLERLLQSTPPSLRNELSDRILKLVERCEALSFAPEKMVGELKDKPKLTALVDEFEKVMNRMLELAEL